MTNKILIFIATYNENLNISKLFQNIINISPNYDVLIIDDNSTDGTKESLEKLCHANVVSLLYIDLGKWG